MYLPETMKYLNKSDCRCEVLVEEAHDITLITPTINFLRGRVGGPSKNTTFTIYSSNTKQTTIIIIEWIIPTKNKAMGDAVR